MIQEYIGGPTYLTQGLAHNGEVISVIPHYKYREWPLTGGVSSRAVSIKEDRLIDYTTKILQNSIGQVKPVWSGNMIHEEMIFSFIEMNPRFEGSVDLAIKSGVDYPIQILELLKGNIVKDFTFNQNIHYRWFYRYDFRCYLKKSI